MTADLISPAGRLLGRELRSARDRRRLSGDQVALRHGWSPSKLSRFETGRVLIDTADLGLLITLYRLPPDQAGRLREIRQAAADGRELTAFEFEAGVTGLLVWAPDVIPPALRTEAYLRALMKAMRRVMRYTPSQIKGQVVTDRDLSGRLLGRHEDDEDPPPALTLACVLDEAVLNRRRGMPEVMREQLAHLDALAQLPNIDLQILPLDADAPTAGPFTYLACEDELADTVQLTGPSGNEQVADDRAVTDYRFTFEDLQAAAADVEESRALIKRAASQWA